METVTVDAKLYESMTFFLQTMAMMGTIKQSHPIAHQELIKLVTLIDRAETAEPANVYSRHPHRDS